jgi:hypothetical protein
MISALILYLCRFINSQDKRNLSPDYSFSDHSNKGHLRVLKALKDAGKEIHDKTNGLSWRILTFIDQL